jgi:hypothetical protein
MIPAIIIVMPQKNAVIEKTGAKINQKMPSAPAIPRARKIKPPINVMTKPIFARNRINISPPLSGDAVEQRWFNIPHALSVCGNTFQPTIKRKMFRKKLVGIYVFIGY